MALIEIQNVTKTYFLDNEPVHAVRSAVLSIEQGEFISVVGHSGSGKSTLLSLIGGITAASSGRILFRGTDITSLGSDGLSEYRAEKIGFMFQFVSLMPMLTVRENLLLPAVFTRSRKAGGQASEKASDLLRKVGLADKEKAYPSQLSGGQQRRVAIARAFMNDPAVILADEPTGDLDEETEAEMRVFFKTMNREQGITFIMVTHNADLARGTQRRIRMHSGLIVQP